MLKISVLNSKFVDSLNLNRLLRIRSACMKFGPRRKFLGTLPKDPGAGVVNAAGLRINRSFVKYGFTPGMRSGRRTLRDAPPPGVFTTAVKPTGSGLAALTVPGSWATNPFGNPPQPAVLA